MKQCRFGLDNQHLDADLCDEIEKIRNGGSWNEACRLYFRFLHHQSKCRVSTLERQKLTVERTNNDIDMTESKLDFSDLDDAFNDM